MPRTEQLAPHTEINQQTMTLDIPLRASVTANKLARREGPAVSTSKVGTPATVGDALSIVDLHRTASGTTRAQVADGSWVTATTRDGKNLLHTEADLDALLEAPGAREELFPNERDGSQ